MSRYWLVENKTIRNSTFQSFFLIAEHTVDNSYKVLGAEFVDSFMEISEFKGQSFTFSREYT